MASGRQLGNQMGADKSRTTRYQAEFTHGKEYITEVPAAQRDTKRIRYETMAARYKRPLLLIREQGLDVRLGIERFEVVQFFADTNKLHRQR